MKRSALLTLAVVALFQAPFASAQTNISGLTEGLTTFVQDATGSLPFAASAGIDWSDAYIGNIVAVPPHFGVGVVVGATTIPGKAVKPLVKALGGTLDSDLPLPLLAANARIGGVVFPFDVGIKVGVLPNLDFGGYTIKYQNFGIDGRWAFFQGEPALPTVSFGGGIQYLAVGVSATYGNNLTFTGTPGTLTVGAPKLTMDLSTLAFEAKAQVSKSLLILTPYLGVSALVGSSTAKAGVASTITSSTGNVADWTPYIGGITAAGFSKDKSVANVGLKVYGGTSLNIFVLRLDFQGVYNLFDGAWGGSLGTRFQL